MRNLWVSSLAWTLLASIAVAQRNHVGILDVVWTNASGVGSPALDARVHYPADFAGPAAPITVTAEGYPVVVFLHGYGLIGNDYSKIGDTLARSGFVAIMLNTAQYSYVDMESDTRAMFDAIAAANVEVGGFFEGALDPARAGLLGHSMGGAVIAYVLNDDPTSTLVNPGYTCALALAPVDPTLAVSGSVVHIPLGLVSGLGDVLTPPAMHAVPFYNSLTPTEGLKFHYMMGLACNHMNIAGLDPASPAVFERSTKIVSGFFSQFLGGSVVGLEAVLGPEGVSDPNLVDLKMDTAKPQAWANQGLRIGETTRVSVAAEDGFAGLIGAGSTAVLPTSTLIGTLLLDPATAFSVAQTYIVGERLDVLISVPNVSTLVGTTFAVQGAGVTINNPFLLGSAISFTIQP